MNSPFSVFLKQQIETPSSSFDFFVMARLVVLLLFILVYSPGNISSRHPAPLAPFAIRAIIDEYYAKNEHMQTL
jgi:hypothetical protein